jgi:lipooligosaccharide transport system permease protein
MKLLSINTITRRFWRVWYRNLVVHRQNWKISFIPPLLEPIFYLLAFGIGLSNLVGKISYDSHQVTYVQFIAPALLATNIMNSAFFENTYSSYVRMYYQKTFDAMMATPLTLQEIITGEIFWGATKSLMGTIVMLFVISFFGVMSYPSALMIIPISFLGGIAFGALGMCFTSWVKNIELFNIPIFLIITPMYLFSGTFFPLENLPLWSRYLAHALPLTHLVNITRSFGLDHFDMYIIWGFLYLVLFCIILFPVALTSMQRRLIK